MESEYWTLIYKDVESAAITGMEKENMEQMQNIKVKTLVIIFLLILILP